MSTITLEQEQKIAAFLDGKHIPAGLGTEGNACSVASINLALTGRLTDEIPPCMSRVVGRWIIRVQDSMPDDMRNSVEWRTLLPLAAGTGRNLEGVRSQIILDWMWETVLPYLQDYADKRGFGAAWKTMTTEKTADAARGARKAADAADAAAYAANAAAYAANAAAYAAYAAAYTADAAADAAAADAAGAAAALAADAADAADDDAAADAAGAAAGAADAWRIFDPAALLRKLVDAS